MVFTTTERLPRLLQRLQESLPVLVIAINRLPLVAASGEVIDAIIVLRLARLDKPRVLSVLQRLMPVLEDEPLAGKLWIVEETSVRVRG